METAQIILIVIIGIIAFDFVVERILEYLNDSRKNSKLPPELEGIYDKEEYEKQQAYSKANSKFGLLESSLSFIIYLSMILFGGFAYVDSIALSIVDHPIGTALVFFGILMFANDIIGTPFAWYSTFVIEEKFGFNKMTTKTFIFDKLKTWLLGAIIGGGLLSLIIWFISQFPETFWIYAWATVAVFTIFMVMFYSSLIVPLFNKQTPLEDGELRTAIQAFSDKVGFRLDNVFVINGSKRSTKANAYFSGLGAKKRIVLFDTLIDQLETEELVAVLAHEMGHYKHKHILSSIIISLIQMGIMFFILSVFIGESSLSQALGAKGPSIHLSLLAFGMLYSPVSFMIGILMNMWSRKNEYEADNYANVHHDGNQLISGLKKLSKKHLSNLTPHPAYVFFHYSHPSLLQRIMNIKNKR